MADIGKWLEMLIGPQLAGLVGGGGPKAPPGVAPIPAVPAGPPAIAPGAVDTSFDPVNVLDNGPKLNDLVSAPTGGQLPPELSAPDEMMPRSPQMPVDIPASLYDVPTIAAPVAPAAIAAPIAARKRAALPPPAQRPLSNVNVVGGSRPNRGRGMWHGGSFGKPTNWQDNRLKR